MSSAEQRRLARRPVIWLTETGPLGFALVWSLAGDGAASWQLIATLAGASLLSVGGAVGHLSRLFGGGAMTIGLLGLLTAAAPAVVTRPFVGFLLLLISIALIFRAFSPGILQQLIGPRVHRLRADVIDIRFATAVALTTWLVAMSTAGEPDLWLASASAFASLLAAARAMTFVGRALARSAQRVWLICAGAAVLTAILVVSLGHLAAALSILALMPAATLVFARGRGVEILDTSWAGLILDHPARLVVATFLFLCVVGFVVLSLPICATDPMAAMDAAFTAVSAVCVTGLITVDTPSAWTGTGQLVILLLIQLGGLGIMTLSTAAFGALGRRLSVRHEEAVAGLFSGEHRGLLYSALRRTLAITFAAELAGAVLLTALFWNHSDSLGTAAWRGLFTAISAFCNAGFALQPDSLIPYQQAPAILHVVAILIVAGGLSPIVIAALPQLARGKVVPLQVKVVLVASIGLLLFGFVAFAAIEWNQSLARLSVIDRLHNAWFQSVTFRTAGFNSIDFTELGAAVLPLAFAWMFIGGAPGGTAGGIKVTTAWVLAATVAGALKGQGEASSFQRRISHTVVYRAIAIATIGAMVVITTIVAVLLTQSMATSLAVFEVFSAVGTVGLSLGGTAELDGLGKVIIMIAMFLGRVGPLTAFLLLTERQGERGREQLEENMEVG